MTKKDVIETGRDVEFIKAGDVCSVPFNIACGRSITLNELIALLSEITGKNPAPTYVAPRPGDVRHSLADISKARLLGYAPHSNFKKELEETVRWFERGDRSEN